jgi:hypothetical protein
MPQIYGRDLELDLLRVSDDDEPCRFARAEIGQIARTLGGRG